MSKSFMYHPEFPEGVCFEDELLSELDEEWVDTPAKLPKEEPAPKTVKKKVAKKKTRSKS